MSFLMQLKIMQENFQKRFRFFQIKENAKQYEKQEKKRNTKNDF